MKNLTKTWIYFLSAALPSFAAAQYPYYRNFNINDGLVSNKVYNIIEDRYGFIWISTDRGVSRYDGVEFMNFTTKDGLPDNEVLGLYEDSTGRIWFNGFSTEPCYYLNGHIYHAANDSFLLRIKKYKPPGPCITTIVQWNNSAAFLILENGRELLVGKDIADIEIRSRKDMSENLIQHTLFLDKGRFYNVSVASIAYWDKSDSLKKTTLLPSGGLLRMHFTKAPAGKICFALQPQLHKIWKINPVTHEVVSFDTDQKYKNLLHNGSSYVLNGDSTYAVYDASFTNLLETGTMPFAFERIIIDHKGNKWFGTFDNGICMMRKHAPMQINLRETMPYGILAIKPSGNLLIIETEKKGLLAVDRKGNCQKIFLHPDSKRIRGYAAAGKHHVVGTDGGLFRMDQDFKHPEWVFKSSVKDVEPGAKGEILIGSTDFAAIYMCGEKDTLIIIDRNRTTAISRANDQEIWLGGLKGISKSTFYGQTWYTNKISLTSLIDNSRIVDIKRDLQGNMWVATDQSGLFFCSPEGNIIRFSETAEKAYRLLSDVCLQILVKEEDGGIWLATTSGISVIHLKHININKHPEFFVMNYSGHDGLPGKMVNGIAHWNNSTLVATPDGLFSFSGFPNPSNETSETVITKVKVNNDYLSYTNLTLPFNQNNLIISFASSFINTGISHTFKYRVKELSPAWITTNTLQIPLLGLKPGSYTFEITAVNSQGNTGKIRAFHFSIAPPWFKQWWFLLLLFVLLILSLGYYYRLIKEKVNMSKSLTLLKLRILRAQMNPHFVFNALSNIQRLIQINSLESAEKSIGTLALTLRKSIDYSEKEFIRLDKEIDYTRDYLTIEKLRFESKFDFYVEVSVPDEELSSIYVPPMILQPLAENAIKHAFKNLARKGTIRILVDKPGDAILRYTVKDDGNGFNASIVPVNSYGLGITRERINLLYKQINPGGKFDILSTTAGTTIIIELPVLKD